MNNVIITKIPMPEELLKGEWHGTVYCIDTEGQTQEEHEETVTRVIHELINDFSRNNHSSVSLRTVKKELVYANDRFDRYVTLVQFRVRDSY